MAIINNYEEMSLTNWQEMIWKHDSEKIQKFSISEIGLLFVGTGGQICENVRRSKYHTIRKDLAKCIYMLLNLYNSVSHDPDYAELFEDSKEKNGFHGLESAIFNKFPRRCFYCGAMHCECNIIFFNGTDDRTKEEVAEAKNRANKELEIARTKAIKPSTIDDYEKMFGSIYGQGHSYSTLSDINAHLMEEISEVNEALCHLLGIYLDHELDKAKESEETKRDNFCSEIADVFSWVCALSRKAKYHIEKSKPSSNEGHFDSSLSYILSQLLHDQNGW